MRKIFRSFTPFVLAAVLAATVAMTGCSAHVRVYDPYYHDCHDWNHETVYYNQWEVNTHRPHVDYNKRAPADQKEYWDYRHSHQ